LNAVTKDLASCNRGSRSTDSGYIGDGEHVLPMRVYYEDTDAGGIVYHSRYLNFAERARTELLRLVGIAQSKLAADHGVAFAVRSCTIEYLQPARFDDRLEVRSRLTKLAGASLCAQQVIWRGTERLANLTVKIAAIGPAGRPARIPAAVRSALEVFVNS